MPRMALGNANSEAVIRIAGNSTSSSLLPMNDTHVRAAPTSAYTGSEPVTVRRLDAIDIPALRVDGRALLKIDTQGFEMQVLQGAESLLGRILGVQLELSLVPLYDGQADYRDLIAWLADRGYHMWNLIPGFVDQNSGRMLQFDGMFFRTSATD
jgi:hypothetical protein